MSVSNSDPFCPNCSDAQKSVRTVDNICPECQWTPGRHATRKPEAEKTTKLIHVLLTPTDYLRLLEISRGKFISEWCRDMIKEALDAAEATRDPRLGVIDEGHVADPRD